MTDESEIDTVTGIFDSFEAAVTETDQLAVLRDIRLAVVGLRAAARQKSPASAPPLPLMLLECLHMFISPLVQSASNALVCSITDLFAVVLDEVFTFHAVAAQGSAEAVALLKEVTSTAHVLLQLGQQAMSAGGPAVSARLRLLHFSARVLTSPSAAKIVVSGGSAAAGSGLMVAGIFDAAATTLLQPTVGQVVGGPLWGYSMVCVSACSQSPVAVKLLLPRLAHAFQGLSTSAAAASAGSVLSTAVGRLRSVLACLARAAPQSSGPFAALAASVGDAAGTRRHEWPTTAGEEPAGPQQLTVHRAAFVDGSHHLDTVDGGDAEDGRGKLSSSAGLYSAAELVDMIVLSIRRIDATLPIQDLHMLGLRAMQIDAARRAQAAEYERLQQQECEGLSSARCGDLIASSKAGPMAVADSEAYLDRPGGRALFLRATVASALKSFQQLREPHNSSSEHVMRSAVALLCRALTKVPAATTDVAHDATLSLLYEDIAATPPVPELIESSWALTMQLLFLKYSQLFLGPAASGGGAFDSSTSVGESDGGGGGGSADAAGGGGPSLESEEPGDINTENPILWLYDTSGGGDGVATRRPKRARDGSSAVQAPSAGASVAGILAVAANDSVEQPSGYALFACRLVQLLLDRSRFDLLSRFFAECPGITRYLWNFLITNVCLSSVAEHAALGVVILTKIIVSRAYYRTEALSALLHLSSAARLDPRRRAVIQIAKLVSDGALDAETEGMIMRIAKKHVSRLPLLRTQQQQEDPNMAGGGSSSSATERVLLAQLDRHLSLYLRMCSVPRHCKHLRTLFEVFAECRPKPSSSSSVSFSSQLSPLQEAIRNLPEFSRLLGLLFAAPGQVFETDVMPLLRRHPKGSEPLVLVTLAVVARDLRERTRASLTPAGQPSPAVKDTMAIIAANCRAMYNESTLRLPDGTSCKDARLMLPVLSAVPRSDLLAMYLDGVFRLSLLDDNQPAGGPSAGSGGGGGVGGHLAAPPQWSSSLLVECLKEILVPSSITDWPDNAKRGLTLRDLLVHLHTAASSPDDAAAMRVFKAAVPALLRIPRSFEWHAPPFGISQPLFSPADVF
jgi:hypothetical protein